MKRFIILVVLSLGLFTSSVWAYSGGTGKPNDPYQIATAGDLIDLGNEPNDYDKHFIMTEDIDLDPNLPGGKVFDRAVIAPDVDDSASYDQGRGFSGLFDGRGHVIRHLTIEGKDYLGLFGRCLAESFISNLGVKDVDINGTGDYVGGLVGWNYYGSITSSYWDIMTSGKIHSEGGTGLTTSQMQDINTFLDAGWDFVGETINGTEDIWFMPENDYPQLVH